jgi:hypothetical protein
LNVSNVSGDIVAIDGNPMKVFTPAVNLAANKTIAIVPVDMSAPGVSLTSPADTSTVSGSVTLSATATDDTGVAGVQFKLDGITNLGSEITVAPYTTTWDSTSVPSGSHTISAVARDAAGNIATSTVSVIVDNVAPTIVSVVRDSNTQITVTFSKPANPSPEWRKPDHSKELNGLRHIMKFLISGVYEYCTHNNAEQEDS